MAYISILARVCPHWRQGWGMRCASGLFSWSPVTKPGGSQRIALGQMACSGLSALKIFKDPLRFCKIS